MNIILLEKIKKLGDIGDEVTVKSGYARNFLVPNKKALYATSENRKYFEEKKTDIKSQNEKLIQNAEVKLKKISGQEIILIRAASESGQLFGSVSKKDIVNGLAEKSISILKNEIHLNKSIKNLTYEKVTINLHPEVSCEITLNVARSAEEATTQKKLGKTITSNSDDKDDQLETSEELAKQDVIISDEINKKTTKSIDEVHEDKIKNDYEVSTKKHKTLDADISK